MDNSEIIQLSNTLAQYVEAALNPNIPHDKRHEAYMACEEFKEKSPFSTQCSIYLSLHGSDLVCHFGLQVMEHCVKYKWYNIDLCEKISIKDAAMSLLQTDKGDVTRHVYLRVGLSRVIVEMMKREWPQQWPTLLPELYNIAGKGHIQAEIVLLTLLRFVEDIAVLQTVEYQQRRKDLYQNLMLHLEEVFTFLLNIMAQHYKSNNVPESIRVINLTLKVLSEIVEFALINHLVAEENRLLPVLCNLLSEENYQYEAAECLNRIALKKGKHEDRQIVCKWLSNSTLLGSVSRLNLIPQNGTLTGSNYLFIKKIAELLASFGSVSCVVVRTETDLTRDFWNEKNFILLLEILTSLCDHPSCVVAFQVNSCWNQLFKHQVLGKNPHVLQYATKWVTKAAPKLVKVPYAPQTLMSSIFEECCRYLVHDFDSNDSFATYFYRFRVELQEAFRHLTAVEPSITFGCAEQWLLARIEKNLTNPFPVEEDKLEWEAIGLLLETVILNLPSQHDITCERGIRLLDLCLNLKPPNAEMASFLLSTISPLFLFATVAPTPEVRNTYITRTLELIFTCVVYEHTAASKEMRSLSKHAACLLVKLASKYQLSLLPYFDHIKTVYTDMKRNPDRLSRLEDVVLLQAMLLINNSVGNYDKQSRFIEDMLAEVRDYWMKLSANVLCDWQKLVDFVGLHVANPSEAQMETISKNRAELSYCVEVIQSVVKRSTWPENKQIAIRGGFAVSEHVYRNPCTPHVLPTLPGIFSLVRSMHSLWTDEAKCKLPPEYQKVHELSEIEKKTLFGVHTNQQTDNALTAAARVDFAHTQTYLSRLYEMCFDLLAKACQSLGSSFYELPNFTPSFGASAFHMLDSVPDHRLRAMTKSFLKPFLYACPASKYDTITIPVFEYFSSYMLRRLSNKWSYLKECRENGKLSDDSDENCKELIEEILNTQLSREYMDVVKTALFKLQTAETKQNETNGNANEESHSPIGSQNNLSLATPAYDILSDLGIKLLRYEGSCTAIVQFLLNAITWLDSTNSLKATFKIWPVMRQLMSDGNMPQELAVQTIITLLQGLQLHGQHDANEGSLLNCTLLMYQLLRPVYAQVMEVLTLIPGINMEDLQKFDQKALKTINVVKVDKGMKDMFRKLVHNIIGKNVGQLFKRKEAIRDLPKIEILRPKGENITVSAANENDLGIANFFS